MKGLMKKKFALLCGLLLSFSTACRAQLKDENLIEPLPPGYVTGFQKSHGRMTMREMVPQGQSVDNWTEMLTTQVFLGWRDANPDAFYAGMGRQWMNACADGQIGSAAKDIANGYAIETWVQRCPLNPSTGKPEITWFRAIKGNDSFYVVQKAFRFEPSREQLASWVRYLNTIVVCDTRIPERPCPEQDKSQDHPL